jgi:hypothetical protein
MKHKLKELEACENASEAMIERLGAALDHLIESRPRWVEIGEIAKAEALDDRIAQAEAELYRYIKTGTFKCTEGAE